MIAKETLSSVEYLDKETVTIEQKVATIYDDNFTALGRIKVTPTTLNISLGGVAATLSDQVCKQLYSRLISVISTYYGDMPQPETSDNSDVPL